MNCRTKRTWMVSRMTKLWDALVEALEGMEKAYCVADAFDEMDD